YRKVRLDHLLLQVTSFLHQLRLSALSVFLDGESFFYCPAQRVLLPFQQRNALFLAAPTDTDSD
ncbi:hypothetical protein, partial [Deinococcus wulumuqiensis]|uniref:hypothetical protein n=1 Tax=Deinococcus wulumuqiensis TaxID=980427 RepID=UPI0005914615